MKAPLSPWDTLTPRAGAARWLMAVILAVVSAGGCDYPFQPFRPNSEAFYSMFGSLDLNADTQWVRVMPVRQDLFLKPEPIDARVTLENLNSGKVITLKDSLFAFTEPTPDAVGVGYAYNFWTTERLEPGASYRLKATRSDGASTSAVVELPERMDFTLSVGIIPQGLLVVRADYLVFVDAIHLVRSPHGPPIGGYPFLVPQTKKRTIFEGGRYGLGIDALRLTRSEFVDLERHEVRISVSRSGWPYRPDAKDLASALLDTIQSDVTNGLGFVGGVETRTIPFHVCLPGLARATPEQVCQAAYNAKSASIAGRITRRCGDPYVLSDIRLLEKFTDGGSDVRVWKTGLNGEYRFDGLEPGTELVLELDPGIPAARLPRLAPGQQYTVQNLVAPVSC